MLAHYEKLGAIMVSKNEWRQQYTAYLERILDLLRIHTKLGVWIGQSSYKSDYFRVFSDAFRCGFCAYRYRFDVKTGAMVQSTSQRPIISGDTIWSFAKEKGWVHAEINDQDERYRNISLVQIWWDAWTYAWERNPPARKYGRRSTKSVDRAITETTADLSKMAAEALDEHRRGLTEELDPDQL